MPKILFLDMEKTSEQLEKEMADFSNRSKAAKENATEEAFSPEETALSLRLTGTDLGMRFDNTVVFNHLPNVENRARYTKLLPLIPPDITTFMIAGKDVMYAPLSAEDLRTTLKLIPQHITKVHASFLVNFSCALPLHVTTLIAYSYFNGQLRIPTFPHMQRLEIRFNSIGSFEREDLNSFLQSSLTELSMIAVEASKREKIKLGLGFKSMLHGSNWHILNKAGNLRSLHFGQQCFTLPDRDFSFHQLLTQVSCLPNRLKKLSFYWDDVYHYGLAELRQLGDALIKKQIEDIELLHSTTGTDRVVDDKTKTIYEGYLDKLDALTRWKAQDALIKDTLSNETHKVPLPVANIISEYLRITFFDPTTATNALTAEAPASKP